MGIVEDDRETLQPKGGVMRWYDEVNFLQWHVEGQSPQTGRENSPTGLQDLGLHLMERIPGAVTEINV
jgi:hypothetical protein